MVPTFTPFFFHWYDGVPPPPTGVAVKVMLVVALTDPLALELILTETLTNGEAVTVAGADVALHPPALVTVTMYVPLTVAVTDCVVAPLLHR